MFNKITNSTKHQRGANDDESMKSKFFMLLWTFSKLFSINHQHKLSAHTKKMKAALVLTKIKNEDLKKNDCVINEMKNNMLDLKRQLLNEVGID